MTHNDEPRLASGPVEESEGRHPPSASLEFFNDPKPVRRKKCVKCGQVKEIKEFGTHKGSSDGHKSYCKGCTNELHKLRRLRNVGARLKHHIAVRTKTQFPFLEKGYVENLESHLGYKMWELKRALDRDIRAREGIGIRTALLRGYHVDHLRPLKDFDCKEIGDDEYRACWAIDNLKLVPAEVNLRKGGRVLEVGETYDDV